MDERIRRHAAVLVDWSARVERGDNVVMNVDEGVHDLAVAVAETLGKRGANLLATYGSAEVQRAYLRGHGGPFEEDPTHELAMYEHADVVLRLGGGRNTTATADISAATRQAAAKAKAGVRESMLSTDWVSTVHPTRSLAQQANMSYEGYQDFVYNAVLRDWDSLADEMAQLKRILDDGSEVRIEKEDTDLVMTIEDRTAVNSAASVAYDSHNLPSGEVFTAPYETEGEVYFDVPMTHSGQHIRDVHLTFEDGEVVEYRAEENEALLTDIIETDDGARRLGELGIGMNAGIDRFTDNILFDEKMRDTVHLALGRAYDACLPEGETGNQSAVHVDMITEMKTDATIAVDGEVIQRDGAFRWEADF